SITISKARFTVDSSHALKRNALFMKLLLSRANGLAMNLSFGKSLLAIPFSCRKRAGEAGRNMSSRCGSQKRFGGESTAEFSAWIKFGLGRTRKFGIVC